MTDVVQSPPLLEIEGLRVEIPIRDSVVRAVSGVDLTVMPGEVVALVGESGSGKTMTALAVMGLLPEPARIVAGDIRFEGHPLVGLAEREYRKLRGGALAMVFQDPRSSLNPGFRVGAQVAEALRAHDTVATRPTARRRAVELLDLVGVPDAAARTRDFPHQLSGGLSQRVMIAIAIANSPKLLLADEPTSALDVTVQAQVLDALDEARRASGAGMLLITHDLGLVAGVAHRVVVMYAGMVMEQGSVDDIFYRSRHPYTRGLLGALPGAGVPRREPLRTIPGAPPAAAALSMGCPLGPRCEYAIEQCRADRPPLEPIGDPGHRSACFRAGELFVARGAPGRRPG